MKIGIVCGYGSILDDNLKSYLNGVIDYSKKEGIDRLILSGGCTFTSSTDSEAKVMHDFIRQSDSTCEIFMEEKALTTLHNFLYSKELINQIPIQVTRVTIFCDQVRYIKVYLLSQIIFRNKIVNIKVFYRKEPFFTYLMQIPSTISHVAGAIFPSVERSILRKKQQWIEKYR